MKRSTLACFGARYSRRQADRDSQPGVGELMLSQGQAKKTLSPDHSSPSPNQREGSQELACLAFSPRGGAI